MILLSFGPGVPDIEPKDEVVVGVIPITRLSRRRSFDVPLHVVQPRRVVGARDGQVVMTTFLTVVAIAFLAVPLYRDVSTKKVPDALLETLEKANSLPCGLGFRAPVV